jgi:hypothetical protein
MEFKTKEGIISFRIKVNCKIELTEENITEIKEKAGRLPEDRIIIEEGLPVRYSLSNEQMGDILNAVAEVTKKDYNYCVENDIVQIHGHVRNDYLQNDPAVLSDRGWSDEETELLKEMIHIICSPVKVDKATVKFLPNGDSKARLSYTLTGEHDGFRARLAFSFDTILDEDGQESEIILIVTVLDRKPI